MDLEEERGGLSIGPHLVGVEDYRIVTHVAAHHTKHGQGEGPLFITPAIQNKLLKESCA